MKKDELIEWIKKQKSFDFIKWDTKMISDLCKISTVKSPAVLKRNIILLCLILNNKKSK